MKSLLLSSVLGLTSIITAAVVQKPAQAATILMGSFDWQTLPPANLFAGTANFMLDKEPFTQGMITFQFPVNNQIFSRKFNIANPVFGEKWQIKSFDFVTPDLGIKAGDINFMANKGTYTQDAGVPGGGGVMFSIKNLQTKHVPEPTSTLSVLALGTLGAASTLNRKLKPSKSTEKETTKVG
ncbi:PEP-CTERM sorting domain-containing protein [Symplocastrum sp. BBK-W-15]|uniref:PEP-CTERM sorting domain-containing protein n=1 Tax=Limnofasciculus baicalensis BBK-W-15 TaxID=2699891 RepID=A0AAE3GR12_9CYAN|nr:PEP-CTERM sorting domain-containing protein [Limnofasciculus baicalensis]MCP2729125.1 PEP-CTERM sorting domain-containing protein [Limnofasciculus baicalensis BBK-W-15]